MFALGVYGAKVNDPRAITKSNTCHAAGGSSLRPNCVSTKVQQLCVVSDEHQLFVAGCELNGADHRVAVIKSDNRPVIG
jgi:hypothetical protein